MLRVAVVLALAGSVAALQVRNGAYLSGGSTNPDEPAHFVTGLMVRDYVAGLAPARPMDYAGAYYLHYPKVSLGHWPPLFYVAEAAWMLVFPATRDSVLVLLALICGLFAASVFFASRAHLTSWLALAAAILCVTFPLIQSNSRMITPELLVAFLVFLALLRYARYLETESLRHAAEFGLIAAAACLAKGSGFVLALVPPFSVLLSGRYRLLLRWSFWLPAPIVLLLCGPWQLLAPAAGHQAAIPAGAIFPSSIKWTVLSSPRYFLQELGPGLSVLFLIGLLVLLRAWWKREPVSPVWFSMLSVLPSIWLFRVFVPPSRDAKNWILVIAPATLVACYGLLWLVRKLPSGATRTKWKQFLAFAAAALLAASYIGSLHPLVPNGFEEVSERITGDPRFRNSVVLVAADAVGEGMVVASIAERERRPGRYVLRSGKVLASTDWNANRYRLRYTAPEQLMAFLRGVPVGLLVVSPVRGEAVRLTELLRETIAAYAGDWELVAKIPTRSADGETDILLYRHIGMESPGAVSVQVDLTDRIGRILTSD